MDSGTVKFLDLSGNGFGFIIPDKAGGDVFFHRNVVPHSMLPDIKEGTRVRFRTEPDRRGRLKASYVELGEPFDA